MFKPGDETKSILLDIVGLLGYLGIGIALWQLTMSFLLIIIYVQFIICLLLLIRWYMMNQELAQLEESLSLARRSKEELQRIQGLFKGMLGLWLYATEPPFFDTRHHFTFIEEEYIIHGDNGTYNWILRGFNTLDKPSQFLTVKFSGDAPIDISSLALSVIDNLTGQRYHDKQIRLVKDMPYLKIFDIIFSKSIIKGQYFELKLSCRWDNTFPRSRKHDYVFFPLGYYAIKGIDKMFVRFVSDVPISYFVLYRLDSGHLVKEPAQPKIVDKARRHFTLEWENSNPECVYILRFTKEVENVKIPLDNKGHSVRNGSGSPI